MNIQEFVASSKGRPDGSRLASAVYAGGSVSYHCSTILSDSISVVLQQLFQMERSLLVPLLLETLLAWNDNAGAGYLAILKTRQDAVDNAARQIAEVAQLSLGQLLPLRRGCPRLFRIAALRAADSLEGRIDSTGPSFVQGRASEKPSFRAAGFFSEPSGAGVVPRCWSADSSEGRAQRKAPAPRRGGGPGLRE